MLAVVPYPLEAQPAMTDYVAGYYIGVFISLAIMVYLFYALIRPEKF
jgi:K+-transporting ATPase KdpF subunit